MNALPDFHVRVLQFAWCRQRIEQADLVLGLDRQSPGKHVILFGKDTLQLIIDGGFTSDLGVCRIAFDSATEKFEYLVAAVLTLKSSCDVPRGSERV